MQSVLKTTLGESQFSDVTPSRSRLMSAIKGKGNKSTEVRFRMLLVRMKISGWKLHPDLPGRPDILFPKLQVVVFLDGCFWHGCATCGHTPKTRSAFWRKKFELNSVRDVRVTKELIDLGFRVLRLWEHELRDPEVTQAKLSAILKTRRSLNLL
jgi:DNA mismatch endonuclease Vsr